MNQGHRDFVRSVFRHPGAELQTTKHQAKHNKSGPLLLSFVATFLVSLSARAQMDPYFTAINYPMPEHHGMLMALQDFQVARQGNNFFTAMGMAEYGITRRWTAGVMIEGQKILGKPVTYGGQRFNTFFQLFPHDHLLHFTLYGEYEDLNAASLYKMEVSGFGGGDLVGSLATARNTQAHTFEQRVIVYHDWGRLNVTFNFINETDLQNYNNSFGYALGVFWQAAWTGMDMNMEGMNMDGEMQMHGMPMEKTNSRGASAPPLFSLRRLGYGVEMYGGLGDEGHFGFYWHREQQYIGPVFNYALSSSWSVNVEPVFGLSAVSDPFVLRTGVAFMF